MTCRLKPDSIDLVDVRAKEAEIIINALLGKSPDKEWDRLIAEKLAKQIEEAVTEKSTSLTIDCGWF